MNGTGDYPDKSFHNLEPDYDQPVFQFPEAGRKTILENLELLYGQVRAQMYLQELERIARVYFAHKTPFMKEWEKQFRPENRFTEKDVILITYGDLVKKAGEAPLVTLSNLCTRFLKGVFNTLHILPFFPYSSDRGFAILDFEEVDPNLGTWEDIANLKKNFKLMFDGVFNHVSSKSRWFQEFLNQNPDYTDFFTVFSTKDSISPDHLKLIVRPRTSDVLSEFKTLYGTRLVWTTFSPDQIDLNYKNPKVLLKMVEILLTYVRRGADIIRLDAVTYLWEELGTSCVHLEQSHAIIQLFRTILDAVAPHVALITETNVAHEDNIRYFGDGRNEAQMVYNFALPPLVLHSFQTGNATKLTAWASGLQRVSETATYFNFLDSHDGIGVMAVKNILTPDEIDMMALRVIEHGGYISYKADGNGMVSPYELNITWYSAINREDGHESVDLQVKRYLASRAISLVLMGVPGVYLHGLLGSVNDADAVLEEKQTRSINRKSILESELMRMLEDRSTSTFKIAVSLVRMIRKRILHKAFHPNAGQKILNVSPALFCVLRTAVDQSECILAIINVRNETVDCSLNQDFCEHPPQEWTDVLTGKKYAAKKNKIEVHLKPYDVVWLHAEL